VAGAGLITELEDGVLTLTFDNPGRLNAMHPAMRAAIIAAFDRADADDDVRVVLVTGAGRGFCAGADMSRGTGAFVPASGDGEYRDGGGILVRRLLESAKPIIGAVNGAAAGIGAAMTLPMDFRLAAASARFGFVYTRRGIGPEGTSSWLLPAIVGPTTALDWLLTGRVFGAEEALARGLVTEVLPDDRLMPRARELARSLCETTAPLSVSLTRQLVWRQLDGQLDGGQLGGGAVETAHRLESRVVPWLAATPDAAEGVSAFLEKRPPRFTGRPARDIPAGFPWDFSWCGSRDPQDFRGSRDGTADG
jgi:enoyl-CoA hydratase/carnithine racemase